MTVDLAPGKKTFIVSILVLLFVAARNVFGIEVTEDKLDTIMDIVLGVLSISAATIRMAIARVEKKVDSGGPPPAPP